MEAALGAANWLLGKVINKLTDDLVAGFVASRELGLNFEKIKTDLKFTLGLLHAAQGRDVSHNPGLKGLLEDLSSKADEAEDALDELHYFMIQDELDGTQEATPELGDGLGAQAHHARHAARNTAGNWLSYFSCCHSQDDVATVTENTSEPKSRNDTGDGHVDKLPFDRVAMSNKIKLLIEDMHSLCPHISELLKINTTSSMANPLERPAIGSTIRQEKLYGRSTIFEQTINHMTSGTCPETLSVLPIVGPGGIGKTTFTQHLYNDKRTEEHFTVRVWVCVSSNFDVLKLTKEILSCIPADENEGSNTAEQTSNLDQLQKSIAKRLKSKRFLIVLDDVWQCSEDRWVNLLAPFTMREAEKGSMVIVTTRFPYIAQMVKTTNLVSLEGLEPGEFWVFFQACVFGEVIAEHDKEELIDTARQIANKLKCSPLAAKTVGRLLKKRFCREHWMEVLEKKEWLNQTHDDDIMPALKISYDYLPYHLKKSFAYCALFPEDYKFDSLEISRFWVSIGAIDSNGHNQKNEEMGSKCLDELLDNGFLMKGDDSNYVMHDLLRELAQVVSSKECAYISCSSFRADDILPSIRHLSMTIEDNCDESFEEEMKKLKRRIDVGNLRSLLVFGEYIKESMINILNDTFKEIKRLRVLFIFMNSPNSLPHNFPKLVHLRYLKLKSSYYPHFCLPSTVSSFYHLKFLDLKQWESSYDLPKDISRLVNLRHFVAKEKFHSNVLKVGKMKFLQELKEFHVKKESVGFELRELGQLEELGGELCIYALENVRTSKEANEAKLIAKRNLIKLRLVWGKVQLSNGDDILNSLQPPSNLKDLCIVNHSGDIGPSWLCGNIHIRNLEILHLDGVSWTTLPPLGQMKHLRQLWLKNIAGLRQFGSEFFDEVTDKSFLKEVVLEEMPELVEWVGGANYHLFSRLQSIRCCWCPKLSALPFSGFSSPSTQDISTIWFPNLHDLHIIRCPKLSLPPLPHTSKLTYVSIDEKLTYKNAELKGKGYEGSLAFNNLGILERMEIVDVPQVSLTDLQKLTSLRSIKVRGCEDTFFEGHGDGVALHSVQKLELESFPPTGKLLSNFLRCFPAVSYLYLSLYWPPVNSYEEKILQFPPSSSLREVCIEFGRELILPMEEGGLLGNLMTLQELTIRKCGNIFSRWSMGQARAQEMKPFPSSLKKLVVHDESSMQSMVLLSNLTALTHLELIDSENLTGDGFDPLITANLINLCAYNCSIACSVAADLLAEVARTITTPAGALGRLQYLEVDSISAALVTPICSRLSSTLQALIFSYDGQAESFTEEQEQALQLLTSLQFLGFGSCGALRFLPDRLHRFPYLKELNINGCSKIQSLPKEGLPASLETLFISRCSIELEKECKKLRGTRANLSVDILKSVGRASSYSKAWYAPAEESV